MKFLITLIAIFTTFLTPITPLLIMMLFFVILDTVTGIYTTIKLDGINSFRSHKLFNVVIKSFFYFLSIILAFTISKYIFDNTLLGIKHLLPKGITMLWIYIEIKSIDETSMKLGNKSFWVILKEFIEKMKSIKTDINEITK
jgi:hypothetical protein